MIRILLADDHAVVRRGLRLVLEREPGFAVVAEAEDGIEARDLALRGDTDLAILDVSMPRLSGLRVAEELAAQRPALKTVLLSMHDSGQYVAEARRAGASAYVLKSAADTELIAVCRAVLRGAGFQAPAGTEPEGDESPLTPRERQVVALVAEGHTSREIAVLLHLSEHTIERHRERILAKLGLRDVAGLTRYAVRHGLVQP